MKNTMFPYFALAFLSASFCLSCGSGAEEAKWREKSLRDSFALVQLKEKVKLDSVKLNKQETQISSEKTRPESKNVKLITETNEDWRKLITGTDLNFLNGYENIILQRNGNEYVADIIHDINTTKITIDDSELLSFNKVRSIFAGNNYWSCKFAHRNGKIFFQKTSGSQRRAGFLYRKDQYSFVFLGGWTVNNDPIKNYDSENSTAGILFKIPDDKIIMITNHGDGKPYEIYEIIK